MSAKTPKAYKERFKGKTRVTIEFSKSQADRFRNAAKNLAKKFKCRQNEAVLKAVLLTDNREVLEILRDEEARIELKSIRQNTMEILQEMIG